MGDRYPMNPQKAFACALLTCALASAVRAKGEPHRTGWWVAAGPRVQWLVGDGYDGLFGRGLISGRGYGGEVHLAYGFTPRWAGRLAVSSAMQNTASGKGGAAWAAADVVLRQPFGPIDIVVFGRFGRQSVVVDGYTPLAGNGSIQTTGVDLAVDLAVVGPLGGAGAGLRYWVTPHIALGAEALYTYVALTDAVDSDGTGTPNALDRTYDGTTWGVTVLAVEYHW